MAASSSSASSLASSLEGTLPALVSPLRPVVDLVARIPISVHMKLFIGFLAGSLLILAMAGLNLIVIEQMNQKVNERSYLQESLDRARQMDHLVTSQSHYRAMALLTPAEFWNDEITLAKMEFSEHLARLEALKEANHQGRDKSFGGITEINERYAQSSERVLGLYQSGDLDGALKLHIDEEHLISHELEGAMREVIADANLRRAAALEGFQADKELLTRIVWGFSLISLLTAMLLGLAISWAFIRPLRIIDRMVASIAGGDFTQRVKVTNGDEFGQLGQNINSMSGKLSSLYNKVQLELKERMQAEAALLDARANLEVKVEERTRQLQSANEQLHQEISDRQYIEEQLLQAQKMDALGRLVGGIAHDFNNLLTPIMGYAQMGVTALPPGHDVTNYFQEIHNAAERGGGLIRQLLVFSRQQAIELKTINLNDVLANVDQMLRRLIREDTQLVTVLAPDLGLVKADAGLIEQVLMNLVINACDAMPDGGVVTIETCNVETCNVETCNIEICEAAPGDIEAAAKGVAPGRPGVLLSVSDTGTGMTEEIKSHIFEPFFTTKEVGRGTGLGLSICYGIVEQINGRIEVASEPDRGTVFKLLLEGVEEEINSVTESPVANPLPRGIETVVLAEDDLLVRRFVSRILRELGYTVLEAANGSEALGVLSIHSELKDPAPEIGLLLSDVGMPEMDGIELARRVRVKYPNIPVILVSGHLDHTVPENRAFYDETFFLQKPFTPMELALRIREVLDRQLSRAELMPSF
jgi:signal transduction histidine kinase